MIVAPSPENDIDKYDLIFSSLNVLIVWEIQFNNKNKMNAEDGRLTYYIDRDLNYCYLIYLRKMKIIYLVELEGIWQLI